MPLTRHFRESHPLKRVVHLFLLLGWLLSSHGLAPAFCLGAAKYDGSHRVKVCASPSGELTVVLSHEDVLAQDKAHDLLCDLLMVFATTKTAYGSDHILAFKTVDVVSRSLQGIVVHQRTDQPSQSCLQAFPRVTGPRELFSIRRINAPAWSPGLALKAGKTIMLC